MRLAVSSDPGEQIVIHSKFRPTKLAYVVHMVNLHAPAWAQILLRGIADGSIPVTPWLMSAVKSPEVREAIITRACLRQLGGEP